MSDNAVLTAMRSWFFLKFGEGGTGLCCLLSRPASRKPRAISVSVVHQELSEIAI